MAVAPGSRIGPYEVVALLGTGGMGEVYRASDPRLGRDVAIKVLPEATRASPERGARFEREARLLASINHPNIATIHGLEDLAGSSAIVMELVDGPSLADLIARGPLSVAETARIGLQIADGMSSAHARGIVHRDLKPSNVRIAPDGRVKILDLGLAKMVESDLGLAAEHTAREDAETLASETREGTVLGTPAYMSPEQAVGAPVDARADVSRREERGAALARPGDRPGDDQLPVSLRARLALGQHPRRATVRPGDGARQARVGAVRGKPLTRARRSRGSGRRGADPRGGHTAAGDSLLFVRNDFRHTDISPAS